MQGFVFARHGQSSSFPTKDTDCYYLMYIVLAYESKFLHRSLHQKVKDSFTRPISGTRLLNEIPETQTVPDFSSLTALEEEMQCIICTNTARWARRPHFTYGCTSAKNNDHIKILSFSLFSMMFQNTRRLKFGPLI